MAEKDEGYKMATQVFLYIFAGCVLFMIASILIGIFEVIPIGPYGDMTK
jgi:hypothetical protein